ncbi:MAG TPA: nitrite reductase small subunit NirD [Steroidobacteraceae bacterium]|nr:nitrite reductase small subunit NirD [Steroidobacteraceae bacterium]
MSWTIACDLDDILPDMGACALLEGRQIALFRVNDAVYALDNRDPASGANVLARGIVGDIKGELVVASPLYKHHYSLTTGRCLEDPEKSVNVYAARVVAGRVEIDVAAPQPVRRKTRRRLVVVGNGMAGMRTVEELLALAPNEYEIVVFGAEPHGNYNRILLSPVLAGEKRAEDIVLHAPEWYVEHGVKLHAGDPIVAIDRRKRLVKSQRGIELSYDRLLLATGSTPIVLPIPGVDSKGVITFRDLADVEAMLAAAKPGRKAVVIGGGLLGLEAANGLLSRGMSVTVVHLFETLMERQLDAAAAALLRASLASRGIVFKMPAQTTAILGSGAVEGVRFADGSELPADLVVMAVGVRPNVELARAAGLRCDRGILVNDTLQSYDPSIYAVGECVQHRNVTFGLVAPLWEQARVCATHLAELGVSGYRGTLPATQLKVTGIELYSAGDFQSAGDGEDIVLRDPARQIYKRLVIRDNKLRGAVLFGDASAGPWYFEMMASGRDVGSIRDELLFGPDTPPQS